MFQIFFLIFFSIFYVTHTFSIEINTVSTIDQKNHCQMCDKTYDRNMIKKHLVNQHILNEYSHQCFHNDCNFITARWDNGLMEHHIKNHHCSLNDCSNCSRRYEAKKKRINNMIDLYRINQLSNNKKKKLLSRLNYTPFGQTERKKIKAEAETDNKFACTHCNKRYASQYTLSRHLNKHNDKASGTPYLCLHSNDCKKTFVTFIGYTEHHKDIHATKADACDECKKIYSTNYLLNEIFTARANLFPVNQNQQNNSHNCLQCSFCKKELQINGALQNHVAKHQQKIMRASTIVFPDVFSKPSEANTRIEDNTKNNQIAESNAVNANDTQMSISHNQPEDQVILEEILFDDFVLQLTNPDYSNKNNVCDEPASKRQRLNDEFIYEILQPEQVLHQDQ